MAVRLDDNEDEALLRDAFRSLFGAHATTAHVRRAEPAGHDVDLWKRLAEMDAPAMAAAADHGGGGATMTDLVIVAEEAGAAIAPVPLNEHLIATRALGWFAPESYRDVILGDAIATIAPRPAQHDAWEAVPAGTVADVVVGVVGDELIAAREPRRVPLANCGSQPLADVFPRHGEVAQLGPAEALDPILDAWRVLTASSLNGLAEIALRLVSAYVLERQQFGRPIGAFQAIQHGLAELPGLVAGSRLLTGKAAWAIDQRQPGVIDVARNEITDGSALASMAVLFAGEAARHVVDRALHYHGALGCTVEADIQLYYRRARSWPLAFGPIHTQRRHLANLLLGAA